MLTESEKYGIRDLLSRLSEDLIFTIADTATRKSIACTSVQGEHNQYIFLNWAIHLNSFLFFYKDAIDAILLHSDSANWLLNRKKLTRNILFEYLNVKKIDVSGAAEKSTVIEKVLQLWSQGHLPMDASDHQQTRETNMSHHFQQPPTPEMGLHFARWFYGMLLTVHEKGPIGATLADQFWRDATLQVTLNICPGNVDQHKAVGSQEVHLNYHLNQYINKILKCLFSTFR